VPTSVLLAVLTAAGLLALAPALVRRYDATERLAAERTLSTARVIERERRRRTVPGRRPVNPPRLALTARTAGGPVPGPASGSDSGSGSGPAGEPAGSVPGTPAVAGGAAPGVPTATGAVPVSAVPAGTGAGSRPPRRTRTARRARRHRAHPPAVYRRRRVLAALVLFNLIELMGLAVLGPDFAVGCLLGCLLLVTYLVYLRRRAVVETRQRHAAARRAARLAARQEELRREQAARAAARREALRRAAAARAAASREALRLSQRYSDGRRRGDTAGYSAVRGTPYESRAAGY